MSSRLFEKGDDVAVFCPTDPSSQYEHGFVGTIVGFKVDNMAVVEDQEGNCWNVLYNDMEHDGDQYD